MKKRPLILITNDDGIYAPGIETLKNSLSELGEVIVIAPDIQRSAVSSALTIDKPLRVYKVNKNGEFFGFSVHGTPADCVKLAISTLLQRKPDLVVSGINHGKNTSINVLYSGTVAGATEGLIAGVNSMAVSHSSHSFDLDLSYAGKITSRIADKLINNKNENKVLLNVNIPNKPESEIKGIKFTKLSSSKWADKYERRLDPFGNEYFWFAGVYEITSSDPDTDDFAVDGGYVSVTPIRLNMYEENSSFVNKDFLELI